MAPSCWPTTDPGCLAVRPHSGPLCNPRRTHESRPSCRCSSVHRSQACVSRSVDLSQTTPVLIPPVSCYPGASKPPGRYVPSRGAADNRGNQRHLQCSAVHIERRALCSSIGDPGRGPCGASSLIATFGQRLDPRSRAQGCRRLYTLCHSVLSFQSHIVCSAVSLGMTRVVVELRVRLATSTRRKSHDLESA